MEIQRELYLSQIRDFYHDEEFVKILVGIRRCGKSIIMKQIINELTTSGVKKEKIIYMDFENYENTIY